MSRPTHNRKVKKQEIQFSWCRKVAKYWDKITLIIHDEKKALNSTNNTIGVKNSSTLFKDEFLDLVTFSNFSFFQSWSWL